VQLRERGREQGELCANISGQRTEPAGSDSNGNRYFILSGYRLYRRTPWIEELSPKKGLGRKKATKRIAAEEEVPGFEEEPKLTSHWSCVCVSLHDWNQFVHRFENSKDVDEKEFHRHLTENVIPEVTKAWLEKEVQRKLQDAAANLRRSSRIDAKRPRRSEDTQKVAAAKKPAEEAMSAQKLKLAAAKKEKVSTLETPIKCRYR
jgi:hypothetical protein